ncbi:Rhotekin [Lonchura striata]|uniref:Rhotekin n=1 Tax=Lonchura striata TaxID=40157 RepID=A0A218UT14_9PASE|nr:Rhotekin [Lonchura striata domestica]
MFRRDEVARGSALDMELRRGCCCPPVPAAQVREHREEYREYREHREEYRAGTGHRATGAVTASPCPPGHPRPVPSRCPGPAGNSGGIRMIDTQQIYGQTYHNDYSISGSREPELQRALERALRVREGARRLLPACSRPEQALETTKTLVLCEARVAAAGGELQRRQEARLRGARRPSDGGPGAERVPCRGTVCISDLRIPLMWKDTEYFRNKGELHRCAVFLLLQVGAEIHDTPTVLVDRTLTDICFEGAVLLNGGDTLVLWGHPWVLRAPGVSGQAPGAEGPSGAPLFCVLRGPGLLCYGSAGEAEAGQEPTLTIAVTKDTRVRALEAGGRGQPPGVAVTNRLGGEEVTHALLAESAAEAQRWLRAFGQHLYDLVEAVL